MKKLTYLLTFVFAVMISLTSCRDTKSGEKIEDGMEQVGEGMEEGAEEVGRDIERGAEEMGDEAHEEMHDATDDN